MARHETSSERTSLLAQGLVPDTQDGASNGRAPDHAAKQDLGHTAASQTISLERGALCSVALAFLIFLQATNISLITTTYSKIARDLDAFEKITWFTSAYLIAVSALAPLNGKLATVFGPRICIFASTVILAAGCLVSSVANSFGVFTVGRCLTGVGASGIYTISIVIVLELSGPENRGLGIGILNSGYTFGVATGATAAGAIVDIPGGPGWRFLFWGQAPISLVAGTILLLAMPASFHAGKAVDDEEQSAWKRLARLDYFGALTLTASIVLLLYALSSPREIPVLPIVLSGIVLLTFILNEVYLASDPIIPISLLKSRGLLLTCLGTLGYMMARWTVLFYTPTYAIAVRQWRLAIAGSILIPTNAGFAIGGVVVGWLHIRRSGSFWLPCVIVYVLFPLTLVALASISTEYSSPFLYVLVVFTCGAVTGAALNYGMAHVLYLTPPSTHYIATSLLATFRGFAGSFGTSIGGGLFTRTLYQSLEEGFEQEGLKHREDLVRRLIGSTELVKELVGVEQEVAIRGYQDALRTLFLAGAGLAFVVVFIQAGTGWTPPANVKEEIDAGASEQPRRDSEDIEGEGNQRH